MRKMQFHSLIPALLFGTLLTYSTFGEENHSYGGSLVLGAFTEPASLNPILFKDTIAINLGDLIFNSLIKGRNMVPVPDLASSWDVSDNGLVWTFHLKQGVRFHDGAELTAEDAAFTYNTIIDPEAGSPFAPLYRLVERFEAIDRYTFRVVLKEPYAPFIYLMNIEIVPSHLLKGTEVSLSEFGHKPVGTGPFVFSSWKKGEIVLSANEDYFEGRPYLDRVTVKVFSNRLSAWSSLMQGKLHVVIDLNYEDFKVIKEDKRYIVYDYLDIFYYTILFNIEDPLFSSRAMRRAIDLAIDRPDIIEKALRGWGSATTGPFMPGTWPYNPGVSRSCDPEEALRILRELGWRDTDGDLILDKDGRDLSIKLLVDRGDSVKERAARRIKWQLFQVGIRVEIEELDLGELFKERLIPGDFQAVLLQFNAFGDPDKRTYFFWHSSGIGRSNLGRYRNSEVDRLLEMGRVTADFSERKRIYQRIHEIIAEDRPAVFLFFRRKFVGISSKFGGVSVFPEVFYRSIKEWFIIE